MLERSSPRSPGRAQSALNWVTHHRSHHRLLAGAFRGSSAPPSPQLALRRAAGQTHPQGTAHGGGWGLAGWSCRGRAAPRPCSWAGWQAHRVQDMPGWGKRGSTQGERLTFMTRFNQKTLIVNSGEIQGAIFFNPFLIQGSCQLGRGGQLGLRPSSRTSRCAGTAGCSCHGSISPVASEYNLVQENNFYDDSKTNTAI